MPGNVLSYFVLINKMCVSTYMIINMISQGEFNKCEHFQS